jgi:hypothetical protein
MNASELQIMLVEMGYYQLQKPIYEPYFAKPKKQLLNLDDFIKMHNSLIDIMQSNP